MNHKKDYSWFFDKEDELKELHKQLFEVIEYLQTNRHRYSFETVKEEIIPAFNSMMTKMNTVYFNIKPSSEYDFMNNTILIMRSIFQTLLDEYKHEIKKDNEMNAVKVNLDEVVGS